MNNRLFFGDNLGVLREHVADASVDLIYLDPPFNSNSNYNVIHKDKTGGGADAQIQAFEDTWTWTNNAGGSEDSFDQVMRSGCTGASELLRAMRAFLGDSDLMAYLSMMAIRLIELHRVLKPTGSLYLHCDTAAGHYLKLLMDSVFGPDRFLNDITWKRTTAHNDPHRYGRVQDRILFYSKSGTKVFHPQGREYSPEQLARYKNEDEHGRYKAEQLTAPHYSPTRSYEWRGTHPGSNRQWRFKQDELERLYSAGRILLRRDGCPRKDGLKEYLHEAEIPVVQDLWTDIGMGPTSGERLGYPTQKPLALLERIISASSNEGDVILDPFCGCGTAVHAAQKLGRQWIGIDVTHLAISLIEKRLKDAFPGIAFEVHGTPKDLASAMDLANRDKYQFQWWAVSMVDALPFGGKKKGADGGIDGIIYFKPDGKRVEKALVSVKGGGNASVNMIRDLHSAMEREKAPIGVFITAALPTRPMEAEAAAVGRFESEATGKTYPRLQIITLAELFQGKKPDIPFVDSASVKRAKREETGRQDRLI